MTIHPNRLLIDSHLDLAWNAIQWERDLTDNVQSIRQSESTLSGKGRREGTVALPELQKAGIGIAFVTTLARCTGNCVAQLDYAHPAQAFAVARGQIAYYTALEKMGLGRLLHTEPDLDAHLAAWHTWQCQTTNAIAYPGLGMALSMESADPILHPSELAEWKNIGVWLIGPAHYGNGRFAGGTGSDLGFTEMGKQLLQEMDAQGLSLDTTHLSDRAFFEVLDSFQGQVFASHNNAASLLPIIDNSLIPRLANYPPGMA